MKYSKERLTEIFTEGERLLKEYHLPTWDELPTIELYMDPVSYTHLDVYKRQPSYLASASGAKAALSGSFSSLYSSSELFMHCFNVFMYTSSYLSLIHI